MDLHKTIRRVVCGTTIGLGVLLATDISSAVGQTPDSGTQSASKPGGSFNVDTLSGGELDSLNLRIRSLIEQLGSDNYRTRVEAQMELERIGVRSLDQLHAASFHSDPQIAATARYIVQSSQFSWAWDTDSLAVRQILGNYSTSQLSDRSTFIDQLQRLQNDEGFSALCRLVRYETQGFLSKRAALVLMQSKPPRGQTVQERQASLFDQVNGGQSQASRWVVKYAMERADFDVDWWKQAIDQESALLNKRSMETSIDINQDLRRWVIEHLLATKDSKLRPEAIRIGDLILKSESEMGNVKSRAYTLGFWALQIQLPEFVQAQHATLSDSMLNEARFGYLLAQSYAMQNQQEKANQIAALTLDRVACDVNGEILAKANSKPQTVNVLGSIVEFQDKSATYSRLNTAMEVLKQNRLDWAESEYRRAIDDSMVDNGTLMCIGHLAELLHSQERFEDAAKVLAPFVQRYEKEPLYKKQIDELPWNAEEFRFSYYNYLGDLAVSKGEIDKARDNYLHAIEVAKSGPHGAAEYQSMSVEAYIGWFKIAKTEDELRQWREKAKDFESGIRKSIAAIEIEVKKCEPRFLAFFENKLADKLNSMAWLIVNTEGNLDEATYMSRRACALTPKNVNLMDTLAHCYAAQGLLEEAVDMQRQAVELAPEGPDLRRALEQFEKKLSQK